MKDRLSRLCAVAAVGVLALGACGGGGGDDDGVASLAGSTAEAAGTRVVADDGEATEEEILAWVECMREQGLDIPDPTVDADGNLRIGGGPRPGGAGGGTTATTAAGEAQPIDREAMQAATEECGRRPRTGGGFSEEDRQEMQDAALEFAQCLRDEGLDVADPDFSAQGPGGAPRGAGGAAGGGAAGGGMFGGLDRDDPAAQAAFEKCQAASGGGFRGGAGRGPAAGGEGD